MLTTFYRTRFIRIIKSFTVRSLSTNDFIKEQNCSPQSPKRTFANEQLKEKVRNEFQRSKKRIFTVPNILTLSRIATTPAIGYFIWNGMHSQALTCFVFAATTDLLDGYIARQFKQSSDLGAVLDPLADKLLMTTCFLAMYNTNLMPLWLVKGFIMRDLLILIGGILIRYHGFDEKPGLKKFIDFKNYPTLGFEPTLISKCNTALQCLLIFLHLSTYHMVGIQTYDQAMFCLQLLTAGTSCFSLSEYGQRLFDRNLYAKLPRSKN